MAKPPPEGKQEENAWRGYWTRMCTLCEEREMYMVLAQTFGAALGWAGMIAAPVVPANVNLMLNFPQSTCTCRGRLDEHRSCSRDRKGYWNALNHELHPVRNANREWLRKTARDPFNVLCRAADARLQARWTWNAVGPLLRACRCGREVTRNAPRVYQCTACEGIIQVTGFAVMPPAPNPQQQQNSLTHPQHFRLQRPRAPHFF